MLKAIPHTKLPKAIQKYLLFFLIQRYSLGILANGVRCLGNYLPHGKLLFPAQEV